MDFQRGLPQVPCSMSRFVSQSVRQLVSQSVSVILAHKTSSRISEKLILCILACLFFCMDIFMVHAHSFYPLNLLFGPWWIIDTAQKEIAKYWNLENVGLISTWLHTHKEFIAEIATFVLQHLIFGKPDQVVIHDLLPF